MLSPAPPPTEYSLPVPQHLENLCDLYLREQEKGGLKPATVMNCVASRALKVGMGAVLCVRAYVREGPPPTVGC